MPHQTRRPAFCQMTKPCQTPSLLPRSPGQRPPRGLAHRLMLMLGVFLALLGGPALAARQALVIGNAAYADSPLRNPVNDARAVAAKLSGLGFAVQKVNNPT